MNADSPDMSDRRTGMSPPPESPDTAPTGAAGAACDCTASRTVPAEPALATNVAPSPRDPLPTDHRPWGYFVVLEDARDHKVKRIVVHPGRRLSLQRHRHRCEHWVVLKGSALATRGDRVLALAQGDTLDVPAGEKHRLQNTGETDLEIIEVQRGDYCGEDDIERFEDDFGRC